MSARVVLSCLLVVAMMISTPITAAAQPSDQPGTLRLAMTVPDGGTALVEVRGVNPSAEPQRTAVHGWDDGDTAELSLAPGTYRITPRQLVVGGDRYVAGASPMQVRIKAGQVATSTVEYVRSRGVQGLQVTGLTQTSIAIDWEADAGQGTTVRRAVGTDAPATQGDGEPVAIDGSSLLDEGLTPGETYTYSIFARPGDGAFGRDDVDPVSITVRTVPEEDGAAGEAVFVLSPQARILDASDFLATPTGDGLQLDLADGVQTPVPGTILLLPATDALPGGYIGEVVAISDDGRSVLLIFAPMGSAFDLYHIHVPDITAVPDQPTGSSFASAQGFHASEALQDCLGGGSAIDVSPSLGMSHGGYADVTIDKYKVLFVDIPTDVNFDVGYTATLTGSIDIESSVTAKCQFPLPEYTKNVTYYPIPLLLSARPAVEVTLSAAGKIEDLGFAATGGFQADGRMGLTGGFDFNGDIINTSEPLQPTVTGSVELGLAVGGSITFGPGVGTKDAGVVIGIGGDLFLVDGTLAARAVDDGSGTATCLEFGVGTSMGIYATLRAWIPGFETDYTVSIDALQGEFPWGGSPWFWPDDCTGGDKPTDDVVGEGVTVVSDSVSGSAGQFGKVPGLVPGEDTWVLSTGEISEVVGSPGFFASSNMGQPGDSDLTALSGYPTYDAAAYEVRLIPNSNTLYITYAFASEEYPEYVGSQYNDAMAVFVDGQNCARVPGTQTPVSINTINQNVNSQYYVDNTGGASGYNTTMDGLTVPLTCAVPVQPGEPVDVKIVVADASDSIYDSAIALVDGGIYSS